MKFPSTPSIKECSQYVDYHCIHLISNKIYHAWVQSQSDTGEEWAINMNASVKISTEFISFYVDYTEVVARKENGGISNLCRVIGNALPITSDYNRNTLSTCDVSGLRNRPCFQIVTGKHTERGLNVHHSLVRCCQSLWALTHTNDMLLYLVASFRTDNINEHRLTDLIALFEKSNERKKIVEYLCFAFGDVEKMYCCDNVISVWQQQSLFDKDKYSPEKKRKRECD